MYIPHITPIEGIDELLKVVSKSDLWTQRITELRELHQWINDHLEVLGTLEDAKKAESQARALVKNGEQTKLQVDEYAARTRADADTYAEQSQAQSDDMMEDTSQRMLVVRDQELAIEKRLKEVASEQEQLAKSQVELEKQQKQAIDKRAEAEELKKEYLDKRAKMTHLAS